jgi:hypothetical protein
MRRILLFILFLAAIPFVVFCGDNTVEAVQVENPYFDGTPTDDLAPGESTAPYKAGGVKVSASLRKRIRELERIAAGEKGQDDAALERILGKLWLKLGLLRFNEELVEILGDRSVDWRLRTLIVVVKRETTTGRKKRKYLPALVGILEDRTQHTRLRGAVASFVGETAEDSEEAREALARIVSDPETPSEVLQSAMAQLGVAGTDDIDLLLTLMSRPQRDPNDLGMGMNAIRALCRSKNPRAIDLLVKIFEETPPDSFYNVTAIRQLNCVRNRHPGKWAELEPRLVPRLLALVDDRSRIGASRNESAELLVKMGVKEVYEPITRWFLPSGKEGGQFAVEGGGGGGTDVTFGAKFLADLCEERGIKVLEEVLAKYPTDPRWTVNAPYLKKNNMRFPEDDYYYKLIQERLNRLKECVEKRRKGEKWGAEKTKAF